MAVDDSYTKSLLHFDGASGSSTFTDESGKTWTARNGAVISTGQSKFGGSSGVFGSSYIDTPASTDFAIGTGDFSIDFWTYIPSLGNAGFFGSDGYGEFALGLMGANDISLVRTGSAWDNNVPHGLSVNTWAHIAVTRSGTNLRYFVNGAQVGGTQTNSINYAFAGTASIGRGANMYFNGYVDEFRFSKGIARWTSNFTPPTSAYKGAASKRSRAMLGVGW